jgi:hypothetical protein
MLDLPGCYIREVESYEKLQQRKNLKEDVMKRVEGRCNYLWSLLTAAERASVPDRLIPSRLFGGGA